MTSNLVKEQAMHRLIRSVGLNTVLSPLVTFAVSIVIARALGTDGRGAYGILMAIVAVLPLIACLGLDYATRFFSAREPENSPSILKSMSLIGVCVGTILAILTITIGPMLLPSDSVFNQLGIWGLGGLALSLLTVTVTRFWTSYLSGKERYAYSTWGVTIAVAIQGAILLTIWRFAEISLDMVALAIATQALFLFILFPIVTWKELPSAISSPLLAASKIGQMLKFGFWMYIGSTLTLANTHVIVLLLSAMSGLHETGLYAAIIGPANILLLFSAPLGTVLATRATKRIGSKHFSLQVAASLRMIFCMSVIAALIGAFAAPWVIPSVFGGDFAGAVLPFRWLLPGLVCMALKNIMIQYLSGIGKPRWSTAVSATNASIGLGLALILLPGHGATGAAIAVTSAHVASTLLALRGFGHFARLRPSDLFKPRFSDWHPLTRVLGLTTPTSVESS